MPFLYYGLVVVATAAVVLAVYNLIVVRWCATQYQRSREANHVRRNNNNNNNNNNIIMLSRPVESRVGLTSSVRYKKGLEDADYEMECSVCLSVYEDGEEVRKLPRCKHSFHAACIDMWLYSHMDCPLCRAPVMLLP